jgi:hypothetical protein
MQKCIGYLGAVLIRHQEAALPIRRSEDRAHQSAVVLKRPVAYFLLGKSVAVRQVHKVGEGHFSHVRQSLKGSAQVSQVACTAGGSERLRFISLECVAEANYRRFFIHLELNL